jgi:hypothetical protein
MKKLKLPVIESENKQEGRYNVVLDPFLNLEVLQYLDAYKAHYPDKKTPKPDELIVAIVRQFVASDSEFARFKRQLRKSAQAPQT